MKPKAMKPKAKTRTVTVKAWGWWSASTRQLCTITRCTRESAELDANDDEVVVRVTLTYEVPT